MQSTTKLHPSYAMHTLQISAGLALLILQLLFSSGCAFRGNYFDYARTSEIKRSVHTRDDVLRKLGEPYETNNFSDGSEVWTYLWRSSYIFCPETLQSYVVRFDPEGRVRDSKGSKRRGVDMGYVDGSETQSTINYNVNIP